jgi:hypothetical protein
VFAEVGRRATEGFHGSVSQNRKGFFIWGNEKKININIINIIK